MSSIQMPSANPTVLAQRDVIAAALSAAIGADNVLCDLAQTRAYECDALSAYRCAPMIVTLPETTQKVAAVMKIAKRFCVPVVPRGAGTSLAGGALPSADCIVLGTAKLRAVLETNFDNRFIRVQVGITNLAVSQQVDDAGFFYAPDPSSQLACAIAGNIAMNSGGAHCLKYGVTANNLLAVKLVTTDGEVVDINSAAMESPRLDLLGLICGSEGQLGVLTEATLRILPKPQGARPIMIGFDNARVAGQCVADVIKSGLLPVAIEYMDRPCIQAVENFTKAGYPLCEALLIIEVEGNSAEIDDQLAQISAIAQRLNPVEMRASTSEAEANLIWLGRKSAFGAMGQINDYMCLDGTVPMSALPDTLEKIAALSQRHGLSVANVFHAGDGNMHPLILFNANQKGDLERAETLGGDILRACIDAGGCLTGEHGVGIEKRELMNAQFNPMDLSAQMRVKDVFDPDWLLNPAKVFPLESSAAHRGKPV